MPAQGTFLYIILTAVITGLLVGVVGKRFAESLLNLLLWPFKSLCGAVYRWIAPRNPFSISMRTYRRHVLRSNLARMENPVGPSLDVPLEHAFAPLKVRSSSTQDSVDLFNHAATVRRCMILGGPGTGKTTLMKSLIISIIKKRCHDDLDHLIPVFVVLRNLAKQQQTVQQALVSALADHHFPGADNFVASSLDAGKLVIILDGLDEVGANREFVAEQILSFCRYDDQREHKNHLLVTCREHSYRSLDLHDGIPEILQVEPFTNHHMRVFLEGWPIHKGRSAIVLYGLIQSDPQIRDICRNPLLLTILTGLYLDTDDFQIPSSRELFYQNAVDELLVRRPARRQIKQQFEANDKRQILERVALERLETVETNEDPEELTQDALREKAEKILRNDKFDFHALIKEVVEINGIIKPMHENTYSCAHRTILEYFAAREALRSRETWKVVTTFGDRPELIEVLYFYCGLLKNLPALATIVEEFIKQNRWLEAGRSLVFMNEAPNSVLVREVVSQLHDAIVNEIEINASLEALSSLANRRDPEFGIARELFANAIDRLSSSDETGASALESAIATSPEIALKLIPNLLRHHSERWRAAGVQLLRDIGTEEALDGLVQLLKDTDPYVRGRAGFVLAGMIKTRNRALRGRARLLPETQDKAVWPLERFFPGSVAIPIAEALAPNGNSESEAINHAIRAISMREKGMDDASLRRWRRVPLDAVLQYYRHRVADLVTLGVRGVGIAAVLILFIVQSICYFSDRGVLISLSPLHFTMLYGHDIRPINDRAKTILSEIEAAYPPAVHGLRRILPWYWDVLPSIPEEKQQTFTVLKRFASSLVTPTTIISSGDLTPELKTLASSTDVEDLGRNVASLSAQLKLVKEGSHFWISPLMDWFRFSTIIVMFCTASVWVSILIFRVRMSGSLKSFRFSVGWDPFVVTAAYWVILFIAIPDKSWYLFVVFGSIILAFICSRMIGLFNWPNNPLLKTVNEVQGIAETRFDFRPAHLV